MSHAGRQNLNLHTKTLYPLDKYLECKTQSFSENNFNINIMVTYLKLTYYCISIK